MDTSMRYRIRAGDHEAFAALFDEHSGTVYRHALALLGDWSAAEDVTSLTFLHAWRARRGLTPDGGSLRPWLLGIATNLARNERRGRRRRHDLLARLRAEPPLGHLDDVTEPAADREQVEAVARALATLGHHDREVVALYVWAELDYAEIAQALAVPIGTVKSRLWRGRRNLERALRTGAGLTDRQRVAANDAARPATPRAGETGDG
ncbi:sigma-70 family RNA polymerase sigma factor [Nonomuraea monospora]|uniref:Sigma-70 family RNA polymerase sigma factor n=2 Tax=Nonomuraea monospora TaxID=568818 RepID=A0ABN3CQY3_9ACTN